MYDILPSRYDLSSSIILTYNEKHKPDLLKGLSTKKWKLFYNLVTLMSSHVYS